MPQVGTFSIGALEKLFASCVMVGLWPTTSAVWNPSSKSATMSSTSCGAAAYRPSSITTLTVSLTSLAMALAVIRARTAGLDTIRSGINDLPDRRLPISGASLTPRLFNGRSMSSRSASSHDDFACRTSSNVLEVGTAIPKMKEGFGGFKKHGALRTQRLRRDAMTCCSSFVLVNHGENTQFGRSADTFNKTRRGECFANRSLLNVRRGRHRWSGDAAVPAL